MLCTDYLKIPNIFRRIDETCPRFRQIDEIQTWLRRFDEYLPKVSLEPEIPAALGDFCKVVHNDATHLFVGDVRKFLLDQCIPDGACSRLCVVAQVLL